MKILVTGGTGVIGEGVIPELISRGHGVRLLSRHARDDAKQWSGIEAFDGDVTEPESLRGAAEGCDTVLHIVGIVAEKPPELTFQSVNIDGTRHVLEEARRSNVRRFLFVSSLGADSGQSPYHQSKRAAERLVEASELDWTIVRPGNVYGPGDEVMSLLLKMVRVSPAVPVIANGDQKFQPIWHEDLAKLLVAVLERDDLKGRTLDAAGRDITTMSDVIQRLGEITDRPAVRVPVPGVLAQLGVDENQLTMLEEENIVRGTNAMEELGIDSTPLDRGLRLLADALKEALPEDGFGSLQHKKFYADIRGSRHTPASLMTSFKEHVNDYMPIEFVAEPGAPDRIEKGATMTGALPLRGNFQVRVEVAEPTHVIFATLEGHPLAGIVEFTTSEENGALRFAVDTWTRASNLLDWIAVRTVGAPAQDANWRGVVQRIIDASGGTSEGVQQEKEKLDDTKAAAAEQRIKSLVQTRKREESADLRPEHAP